MPCTCAIRAAWARSRNSRSAMPPSSTIRRAGRPTARRSLTPTTALQASGPSSTSTRARTPWSPPIPIWTDRSAHRGRPTANGSLTARTSRTIWQRRFSFTRSGSGNRRQVTDGMVATLKDPHFDRNRQVPVLHRQHRRRTHHGRHRDVQLQLPGHAQRLRRRSRQESHFAPVARERRGKGGRGRQAEDKSDKKGEDKKAKTPPAVKIDFDNLDQRILALPIPARNYAGLMAGKSGVLFLFGWSCPSRPSSIARWPAAALSRREAAVCTSSSSTNARPSRSCRRDRRQGGACRLADGEKISARCSVQRSADKWFLAGTAAAPKPGEGALKTDDIEVRVDPRAEWKQTCSHEVWAHRAGRLPVRTATSTETT